MHDAFIIFFGTFECIEDTYFTIVFPVSHTTLVHVFDGINVVVTYHHESGLSGCRYHSQVVGVCPVSYTHLDVYKRQGVYILSLERVNILSPLECGKE